MKYWKVILDNDKQAIMIPEKIIIQEEENLYINSIFSYIISNKRQDKICFYIKFKLYIFKLLKKIID